MYEEDEVLLPAFVGTGGSVAFSGVVVGEWWLIGLSVVLLGLVLVVMSRRVWRPNILTED